MLLMDMTTNKPLPDDQIHQKLLSLFSSNGMVADTSKFPSLAVLKAYGIEATVQTPSTAMTQWAEFMADMAFRVPPLYVALAHRTSDVLVYNIEATNPYPKWVTSFGRSNHAINDLFLFNAAKDQVPLQLQNDYCGAVAQIRSAWLDFCYGIQPWKPLNRDDGSLGPVFTFQNGPKGRLAQTSEEAFGGQKATRWRTILRLTT